MVIRVRLPKPRVFRKKTVNDKQYTPVMYTPETIQTQHAGANGELLGCMRREIKTFFDYDNAPFSTILVFFQGSPSRCRMPQA